MCVIIIINYENNKSHSIFYKGSMYLFKTLPLANWKLTIDDLFYLENLILNHPITSAENSLSRHILSKLHSGCNENDIKYVNCFPNFYHLI